MIENLESKFNVNLPPIFKEFNSKFKLEELSIPSGYHINHPKDEIGFGSFDFGIESLFSFYNEERENYDEFGIFPITYSGIHSMGINVGIKEGFKDKIVIPNETKDWELDIVAEDFNSFIKDLQLFDFNMNRTYQYLESIVEN